MKTKVVIIGAGPAGLLLSHVLRRDGIDNVVLERQSREYVLGRIRAGVLEWGSVDFLRQVGLGKRLDAEGLIHTGTGFAWSGHDSVFIDMAKYTGTQLMAYGQTRLQEDLFEAHDAADSIIIDEAKEVQPHDVTDAPYVTYEKNGETHRVDCEYIVGCDGFHGVSRTAIPSNILRTFEKEYPFGWLGILSETPPLPHLIYANHTNGFALASQRNPMLSRYYIQCSLDDTTDQWSDDRFWDELLVRMPADVRDEIVTGPSVEKSIAPVRSFVAEPMRHGNLFLAGDAAHIVPPTGAKGLNLAISDVYYLRRAFRDHYDGNDDHYLDCYSEMALRRVWSAVRFSWDLTTLLHRFPEHTEFDRRAQENQLEYLASSEAAQASLSEQYVGLPFES